MLHLTTGYKGRHRKKVYASITPHLIRVHAYYLQQAQRRCYIPEILK